METPYTLTNHYYDENGYYVNSAPAHVDSEPPNNATRIQPLSGVDQISKWVVDTWVLVPSCIGTVYYTQDGTKYTITDHNVECPFGSLTEDPPSEYHNTHDGENWILNVEARRSALIKEVQDYRDSKLNGTITVDSHVLNIDQVARNALSEAEAVKNINGIETVPWDCVGDDGEEEFHEFGLDWFMSMYREVVHYTYSCKTNCNDHRNQIKLLVMGDEGENPFDAYDYTTGWTSDIITLPTP